MALEEHSLDPTLERRCAVCGAELTQPELVAAREVGGPFLCMVHADEEPADVEDDDPSVA
jgi:hypothetical protein